MIGVKPEGADGAAVHVIGGAVDTQWVRAFAQAHEKAGFDRVLVGYTSTSAEGFAVTGLRGRAHRAAQLPHRAPARLRGADAGRARRRHAGPRDERPRRAAHHHGRQRRRADAATATGSTTTRATPHRRIPGRAAPHVDGARAVRSQGRVLPVRKAFSEVKPLQTPARCRSTSAAPPSAAHRGRPPSMRRVRALGRAAGRRQAAHRRHAHEKAAAVRATSRASACRCARSSRPRRAQAWEQVRGGILAR